MTYKKYKRKIKPLCGIAITLTGLAMIHKGLAIAAAGAIITVRTMINRK